NEKEHTNTQFNLQTNTQTNTQQAQNNFKNNENYQINNPIIIKAEEEKMLKEAIVEEKKEYQFPKLSFLNKNTNIQNKENDMELRENSNILVKTLKSFNVNAQVINISKGPSVTRYELSIEDGIKVSKILGLSDNLALSLAASSIRIEAPIPGKSAVGIEIPNKEVTSVYLSEVICSEKFQKFPSKVSFGLGKDITGNVIVTDIAKMPHMLIAGSTGSGKSVCINTLITSILYKASPEEVKLMMIDPKVVELSVYNGIPHLLTPVVTEPEKAAGVLNWAVSEMMERYNLFAQTGTRNLVGYNEIKESNGEEKLPQIVIIIDELADLMMVAAKEVEASICRLAQLARAAGIHLIIATQRPSVDVITGLIKANVPSRIAFAVSSGTDSRTVIDSVGAEKLLGKGDMLFKSVDMNKPLRIQGAFISDKEVESIVTFIKENSPTNYDESIINKIEKSVKSNDITGGGDSDELTEDVIAFLVRKGKASTSMIQRQFRIGYNRAARIMEELEDRGIISSENGSKQRDVLMDKYQYEEYMNRYDSY
ncbi:MAG: DNA translocase FtsK, partial [Eubacteriales bacterium]|nr:DNA translocase FtsK [Eubacteriales bacterium]